MNINSLYKSRKQILKIIEKRGWDISKYIEFSNSEIIELYNSSIMAKSNKDNLALDMNFEKEDNNLLVKYIIVSKVRTSTIISLVNSIIELNELKSGDTLILILKDTINSEDVLDNLLFEFYKLTGIFIQFFWIKKITFDIMDSDYVPKHEKIGEEELEGLMKNLNIDSSDKLPVINKFDPVAKYLGLKENDVCRIHRISESAGISYYYRVCK